MLARGGKGQSRKGKGTKDENIPSKICVTCGRPFTWRKKWERCWDEVQTCSKRCNSERRKNNRVTGEGEEDGEEDRSDGETKGGGGEVKNFDDDDEEDARRQEKKAAKKAAKAARRAKREGNAPQGTGQKACQQQGCGRSVDLLVRCQTDDSNGQWLLVCGKCWKSVSGGVVDGDAKHPGYRYGGLWKNRHVVTKKNSSASSTAPEGAQQVTVSPSISRPAHEGDDDDERALSALLSAIGT